MWGWGEKGLPPTSLCLLHPFQIPGGSGDAAGTAAAPVVGPGNTAMEGAVGDLTASGSSQAGFLLPQPH